MKWLASLFICLIATFADAHGQIVDPELRQRLIAAAADSTSFGDRFDAEVWLTDMSARLARQVPDPERRIVILKTVHSEAKRADLPPEPR